MANQVEIAPMAEHSELKLQLSMLVRLGLVDLPDPIPPEPKPIHLAHNQRLIKLGGKEFIQTVNNPNMIKRRF
jgi:hypothetical protein